MIKKLLLVTLFDEANIGNRLQNYALQKVIENYGVEVTTLDNFYTRKISVMNRIKYFVKNCLIYFGHQKYVRECKIYVAIKRRKKSIKKFNKNNISMVKQVTNQQAFHMDWSCYDMAIAGSDQIWHKWRTDEEELPFYYLQFFPLEKRASYAASFGFESFPLQDIEQHREGLLGMRYISCREERGCTLVKELIGKEVPRVLDPTLLLKAQEWRNIEQQASSFSKTQENYAFLFFLGDISEEYKEYIKSVMVKNGIKKLIDFEDKQIGACGPCEFLSFIDRAQYVFTDSFHCTVFSVIFDKKFTAFRRIQPGFENMFGRIEDLLASTNKLHHIYGGTLQKPKNNFDELYQDSIRYIESVLGIKNEN